MQMRAIFYRIKLNSRAEDLFFYDRGIFFSEKINRKIRAQGH